MGQPNTDSLYRQFIARLREIALLSSANNIAEYDMEVFMPAAGAASRSDVAALLAGIIHTRHTSAAFGRLGGKLLAAIEAGQLSGPEAVIVRRAMEDHERSRRLPKRLVEDLAKTTGAAHHLWVEARQNADFSLFRPSLERIVELKIREAQALGWRGSPYDALLERFEPGMTAEAIGACFGPLCDFLKVFVRILAGGRPPNPAAARLALPLDRQVELCEEIAWRIGLDKTAGRLDRSAHPFTARLHPGDTRITTRYDERDLLSSVFSTIHETGHALYEQALPAGQFGNCAGEAASYGIHESQSRLWENLIGRSRQFSEVLVEAVERHGVVVPDLEDFYRAVNMVTPSLIRVEADEVTYGLHVALRFEIERGLIEGRLAVKDLPEIWRAKMREYLGVEVPDDGVGVLQDVHWSAGLFGYFPSYALGNLYASQLFEKAERELPDLWPRVRAGDLAGLRSWLNDKVWRHGGLFSPAEIVSRATGSPPSADAFRRYLERKYSGVYRLK